MQPDPTPLLRRLNDRKPQPPREPEWLRRMREQNPAFPSGLRAKEMREAA